MGNYLEIALGALGGGVGVKIIDHLFSLKKYNADVRKVEIETDSSLIGQWKDLYEELKKIQKEQNLRIDALEFENEKLRLECKSLQHQISLKV